MDLLGWLQQNVMMKRPTYGQSEKICMLEEKVLVLLPLEIIFIVLVSVDRHKLFSELLDILGGYDGLNLLQTVEKYGKTNAIL